MNGKIRMLPSMKISFLPVLIYFILCFASCSDDTKPAKSETSSPSILRCYGDSACAACLSCNYCKLCNAGGSCGVCDSSKNGVVKTNAKPPAVKEQCNAITKKGTRCKRLIKTGIYCWQHQR